MADTATDTVCSAPLDAKAFRRFRKKHKFATPELATQSEPEYRQKPN